MDFSALGAVVESTLPWYLSPNTLNGNEDIELAQRRLLPPTIDRPGNGKVVNTSLGENMAKYADVAQRAAQAAQKYAPTVVSAVNSTLSTVTGGKVVDITGVSSYVGNNPSRLKVTTEAMLRAGVNMGDVIPRDLIGTDKNMMAIRASAERLVSTLQQRYDAGSDKTLDQGLDNTVIDLMRRKRVEAVRAVYGNESAYFLCHPNGGVSSGDFAWYDTVIRGRR